MAQEDIKGNNFLPFEDDILGRKIETLVSDIQQAGYHQAIWNAGGVSSGIYFYRILAGEFVESKKMLLLK